MLDNPKSSYKKLLASKEFKQTGFLCSIFVMASPEELKNEEWQFDFYDEKKDKMTSYTVGEEVKIVDTEADIFKEENTIMKALTLDEVQVSFDKALEKARSFLENETENRIIIVLQKEKVIFWNISLLTTTFNLLNIRMNAISGEILETKKISLLSFKN